MSKAWILMTAMPPTKGHRNLIRFGASLADEVTVVVVTQPHEPYASERFLAVTDAAAKMHSRWERIGRVHVEWLHRTIEQNPEAPGFWDMWVNIMIELGARPGDMYVTSEPYGAIMAEKMQGIFMPYDPQRELYYTKATNIRENMTDYFHDILPEFQRYLRTNVVIFGAESTGKTTLSKELSYSLNGHWIFEWARPYLETVGPDISVESMTAIWQGQRAIQDHAEFMYDKPFAIFDTDLFSTVGYWEQPHWTEALGPVPEQLVKDALDRKADLYLITKSNIPFEQDVIRYGGDRRESPDEFWIDVAKRYGLDYVVLEPSAFEARMIAAEDLALDAAEKKAKSIYYERESNN